MVYYIVFMVFYVKIYYGILFYVYFGDYGEGCYGIYCFYRKGGVLYSNII